MWEIVKSIIIGVAIDTLKRLGRRIYHGKKSFKNIEYEELRDGLETGEFEFGDRVRLRGTYSEFVPFINMARIAGLYSPPNISPLPTCGPCKIGSIRNVYCTTLLEENINYVNKDSMCIPLFCSSIYAPDSLRILSNSSGDIVEIEGYISPIPDEWKNLLIGKESFTFKKRDGTISTFGIEVLDTDFYGVHLDRFEMDLWYLVHFEGNYLPLTSPEWLSLMNEPALPELLVENCFSGCFQFVLPQVNIYSQDSVDKTTKLRSFALAFPEIYLSVARFLDERLFSNIKKNRQRFRYVRDLSFDSFSIRALGTKQINKGTFRRIDTNHQESFAYESKSNVVEYLNYHANEISSCAKHFSTMVSDPLLIKPFSRDLNHFFREAVGNDLDEKTLDTHERYLTGQRRLFGYFVREYGQKREADAEDFAYFDPVSNSVVIFQFVTKYLGRCIRGLYDFFVENGIVYFCPKPKGKPLKALRAILKALSENDKLFLHSLLDSTFLERDHLDVEKLLTVSRLQKLKLVEEDENRCSLTELGEVIARLDRKDLPFASFIID